MTQRRFSISTWSLHGLLQSGTPLLEIPAQVAAHGIGTIEVCHFHFPTIDRVYLTEFRAAVDEAGLEFYSVLIDDGDITSPDAATRDGSGVLIRHWIEQASIVGAAKVRIGAGQQPPTPEVLAWSAYTLNAFADYAKMFNVETYTENWRPTSLEPLGLLEILDGCQGKVGLCADTGNAEGPNKYETLELLLPRATSVHFKASYDESGQIGQQDLDRCTALVRAAKFDGPVTLIYGDTQNEWDEVDILKEALTPLVMGDY